MPVQLVLPPAAAARVRILTLEGDVLDPGPETLPHYHFLLFVRLRRIQRPLDDLDRDRVRRRGTTIVPWGMLGWGKSSSLA